MVLPFLLLTSHFITIFKQTQTFPTSGGMKRKLSMGIALCGRSKHLILDEPSSGIDVRARRELWSILQKYRKERTMLISTHYMDEAEALADRIVIIGKKPVKKQIKSYCFSV